METLYIAIALERLIGTKANSNLRKDCVHIKSETVCNFYRVKLLCTQNFVERENMRENPDTKGFIF